MASSDEISADLVLNSIPKMVEWICQTPEDFVKLIDFTSNKQWEYKPSKVELRPSLVHSKGVFAKQDIKKGECVTFYPIHQMGFNGLSVALSVEEHKGTFYDDYRYDYDDVLRIAGIPDIYSGVFLGHMINDPMDTLPPSNPTLKELGDWSVRYLLCAKAKANVEFIKSSTKPLVEIRALKDIAKDTEILVSYSPTYWVKGSKADYVANLAKYMKTLPPAKMIFFIELCASFFNN